MLPEGAEAPVELPVLPEGAEAPVELPVPSVGAEAPVALPVLPEGAEAPVELPVPSEGAEAPVELPVLPEGAEAPVGLPVLPEPAGLELLLSLPPPQAVSAARQTIAAYRLTNDFMRFPTVVVWRCLFWEAQVLPMRQMKLNPAHSGESALDSLAADPAARR
ncbi:hypothetical protein DBR42_22365 [Pelomonas sp. HMWF004]|nr:hypothetical protein DBR42_22365 [Pelomonas sp. HMWF004]